MSARPPRILAIMGSGETAPTMVTPHREIVARLGEPTPRAVLLDTPYGFQENASEITERAVEYFAHRVQLTIEASGFLGPLAVDQSHRAPLAEAAALSRLRTAGFVFAGPGSPSYALSVWRSSPVPEALTTKLAEGGAVVFSSAAALTLGSFSIPVYEIYKVGQPVHWLDGLGLMRAAGFEGSCVVIPHYDNAEGGTHDTRFCYLGERRLAVMEGMLPQDAWVLGIDEHTVLVADLDAKTVVISGRGGVTVRRRGQSRVFPAGTKLGLDELLAAARGEAHTAHRATEGAAAAGEVDADGRERTRVAAIAAALRSDPARAGVRDGDRRAAGARGRRGDSESRPRHRRLGGRHASDRRSGPRAGRPAFAGSTTRRGRGRGLRDPRELLAPLVESLITLRGELRAARAFELADRVRDRLIAARIELRDTPGGTVWELRPD